VDGTVVLISRFDGALTMMDVAPAAVWAMNSERTSGLLTVPDSTHTNINDMIWGAGVAAPNSDQAFVVFIFPVPTRIDGIYPAVISSYYYTTSINNGSADIYTSTDTTNGIDGTWTLVATKLNSWATSVNQSYPSNISTTAWRSVDGSYNNNQYIMPINNDSYRRSRAVDGVGWTALAGTGTRHVKGLRINYHVTNTPPAPGQAEWGAYFAGLTTHIYGGPDNFGDEDRLAMWRPDLDVETPAGWFDYGDTPLSSSADKSFRIKNVSGSLTATSIVIRTSPSFTDSPTNPHPSGMFLYSMDNKVTWSSSLTIAALSPGSTSGVLWVRRTIPANAPLSNWAPRILADVGTWA